MKVARFFLDTTTALVASFHHAFKARLMTSPQLPRLNGRGKMVVLAYAQDIEQLAASLKRSCALHRVDCSDESWEVLVRLQLIIEEAGELARGLGSQDIVETMDALGDLQYVVDGTWLATGLGLLKTATVQEIHRSNMTKLDGQGHPVIHESGRVEKGPNFEEPDLAKVLSDFTAARLMRGD